MGEGDAERQGDRSRKLRSPREGRSRPPFLSGFFIAWTIHWVFLLGWALYLFLSPAEPNLPAALRHERILLAYLWMLALSFPSGFVGPFFLDGIAYVLSAFFSFSFDETTTFSIFLMWLSFFICGYLQWFQLVPWIIKKLRKRSAKGP